MNCLRTRARTVKARADQFHNRSARTCESGNALGARISDRFIRSIQWRNAVSLVWPQTLHTGPKRPIVLSTSHDVSRFESEFVPDGELFWIEHSSDLHFGLNPHSQLGALSDCDRLHTLFNQTVVEGISIKRIFQRSI